MQEKKFNPHEEAHKLSSLWYEIPNDQLFDKTKSLLDSFITEYDVNLELVKVTADGQVIVSFIKTPSAAIRGSVLLDLEAYLKRMLDIGITVWHESLGDKNSLRRFRGVEVKNFD